MSLQQELHSLINNSSADQLFTATYSSKSPIHNQFAKFLGLSYTNWLSNNQQIQTDDEIKQFKHAIENTHALKLTSMNQKDKRKYFASFEKNPLHRFMKLYTDNHSILTKQLLSLDLNADLDSNTTKDCDKNEQTNELNLLSSEQRQLWQPTLPSLNDLDSDSTELKNTFLKKLEICSIKFNFNSKNSVEQQLIETKTEILLNILEYMTAQTWYDENDTNILPAIFHLIRSNLFRTLPAGAQTTIIQDEELENPFIFMDEIWKQLQLVYDLTLRVVIEISIDKKRMLKHFQNDSFICQLMQLFQSPDYREREYLKTILHRIYGRFMPLRQIIRKYMAHYCYNIIYCTKGYGDVCPYGIAELLEIYCSIIHGFGYPIKEQHLQFCRNVLVPLHKCFRLDMFHEQLVACCVQFVFKQGTTGLMILGGLLKFWPVQSINKQEMFIAEFVNIIDAMINHRNGFSMENDKDLYTALFLKLVECMGSENVRIAERALLVYGEDACEQLMDFDKESFWPRVVEKMMEINKSHFCESIRETNRELVDCLKMRDEAMFDKICQKYEYMIVYAYIWKESQLYVFLNNQCIPSDIAILCAIYYRYHFPTQ